MRRSLATAASLAAAITVMSGAAIDAAAAPPGAVEYRVLATLKTSTMEDELNQAAEEGFRLQSVMGGETEFGGKEVVAALTRTPGARGRYAYRLLATLKTSTMEKEIQEAADAGYEYKGQTVFQTAFGGREVIVIMERDKESDARSQYRLVATMKTSTLQKEFTDAGAAGYAIVGMTVGRTALGGKELVAILRKDR